MPTSFTIFPIQENISIWLLRNFSCAQFHLSIYWVLINSLYFNSWLGPPLWWSWSKECSKCTLWAPPRHSFLNSLTVQVLDLIQGQLSALCQEILKVTQLGLSPSTINNKLQSIEVMFDERSSLRADYSTPNILHSVMTRDLKYPDPLLSLGATHCLSRKFISKTLKVQKRLGMGMSSRCYSYPLVLKLYSPQMHTYNIQYVSLRRSLPTNGKRAWSTVLQKRHSWTVCIIIH